MFGISLVSKAIIVARQRDPQRECTNKKYYSHTNAWQSRTPEQVAEQQRAFYEGMRNAAKSDNTDLSGKFSETPSLGYKLIYGESMGKIKHEFSMLSDKSKSNCVLGFLNND